MLREIAELSDLRVIVGVSEMLSELKDYGLDVLGVAGDLEVRVDDPVYMSMFVPWFKRHALKLVEMAEKQERAIEQGFMRPKSRETGQGRKQAA